LTGRQENSEGLQFREPRAYAAGALCASYGLSCWPELTAYIKPRRPDWMKPLAISGRIREECEELQAQPDETVLMDVWGLIRP
jgi:hypothetical protein